ncbi:MAG: pyruvate ferredoxin oxidoreductase subunit gamma [Chloroflexi bacterium]|nr:pyruvate ferredoxin oxidoreductase subunit gamma [Chloroflexota bacterium]
MKEIRFHGRGGQGVVTAAEILGRAATLDDKFAQSMPSFGAERRGAPVSAFTRVDSEAIRAKCQIYEPDIVVVLDPVISNSADIIDGLKEDGALIVNSTHLPEALENGLRDRTTVIDATQIALDVLGRPITNTVILGALVAATGIVSLKAVEQAIREAFPPRLAEVNIKAVRAAYEQVAGGVKDAASLA